MHADKKQKNTMNNLFHLVSPLRRAFLLLSALVAATTASANDSGYATYGNMLIPFVSTDIAVDKEILTIRLTDEGKTYIDVDYTFINRSSEEKTILMGFEADPGYPGVMEITDNGHPEIYDFTVVMNGSRITPKTSVVLLDKDDNVIDRKPIDVTKYVYQDFRRVVKKGNEENYEAESWGYAFVYSFNATFKPGENHIHHTYNYQNGAAVMENYFLTYKLSPAARWAGGSIRDFTLRITAPNTAKHFFLEMEFVQKQDPKIVSGVAKFRNKSKKYEWEESPNNTHYYKEISMRDATLEWHLTNYSPKKELEIKSADGFYTNYYTGDAISSPTAYYDRSCGIYWLWMNQENYNAQQRRLIRNLPYASRGYVFKDAALRKHFNNLWWYMPDPSYNPDDASDLTDRERELISTYKK